MDSIRYIKKIPDTTISSTCKKLLNIIKKLSYKDKTRLVRLAFKYPPSSRALLGAILEELGNIDLTEPLSKSLNPITTYKLTGAEK